MIRGTLPDWRSRRKYDGMPIARKGHAARTGGPFPHGNACLPEGTHYDDGVFRYLCAQFRVSHRQTYSSGVLRYSGLIVSRKRTIPEDRRVNEAKVLSLRG